MIANKILKFGYGDIGVSALGRRFYLQQMESCYECGTEHNEATLIGKQIEMWLSYKEYCDLCEKIRLVETKEILSFSFKGYIFDFHRFDEGSIRSVKRCLQCIGRYYCLLSAV